VTAPEILLVKQGDYPSLKHLPTLDKATHTDYPLSWLHWQTVPSATSCQDETVLWKETVPSQLKAQLLLVRKYIA